jgi:hypothetical protein
MSSTHYGDYAPATLAESPLRDRLGRVRTTALVVGAAGVAVSAILGFLLPSRFMPAYLVGFLFWFGVAFGCIGLSLLQHLVFAGWGMAIRRPLEAGAMTIFPLALLFLPILLGMGGLYPWVRPSHDLEALIAFKQWLLNPTSFALRALIYFLILGVLAVAINRWSDLQDRTTDRRPSQRLHVIAGPSLVILFLLGTFVSVDWIMSREPTWPSTIYGAMVIVGWGLTTFCVMILTVTLLRRETAMRDLASTSRIQDLGNLTLAFVMLWAYMGFAQFLIIWAGNLSEETPWYVRRGRGGWQYVVMALMLFHFAVPFLILLFRESKRRAERLAGLAAFLMVMRLLDITWLVVPAAADLSHGDETVHIPWMTMLMVPIAAVGIGGIWLASYLWFLKDRPLVARNVPDVLPVPEHAHEGAH